VQSVAVGNEAIANGTESVSLGYGANSTGNGVAVGAYAKNGGYAGVVIGDQATMNHSGSIVFGQSAASTGSNQFVAGGDHYYSSIRNVYFGRGVQNADPVSYAINGTSAVGTDLAGGSVTLPQEWEQVRLKAVSYLSGQVAAALAAQPKMRQSNECALIASATSASAIRRLLIN
jgi:hypothetical protein